MEMYCHPEGGMARLREEIVAERQNRECVLATTQVAGKEHRGQHDCSRHLLSSIERIVLKMCSDLADGTNTMRLPRELDADEAIYIAALGSRVYIEEDGDISAEFEQHCKRLFTKKFAAFMRVASIVHSLLKNHQYATKREIFYRDVALFGKQETSDQAIRMLAAWLRVPRRCLNIVASEGKGIVAGDVKLYYSRLDEPYDCQAAAYHCNEAHGFLLSVETEVDYCLVFESESTFNVAITQGCAAHSNCMLVTGKGYPDTATCAFVASLAHLKPDLPIFVICDSDSHGVHILCTYAFGSLKSPTLEGWMNAAPSVRWLGIHASDVTMHTMVNTSGENVLESCTLPMSQNDKRHCERLLKADCLEGKPKWKDDLRLMLGQGVKIETESVATQHPAFFVQEYIPHKIRFGHWL